MNKRGLATFVSCCLLITTMLWAPGPVRIYATSREVTSPDDSGAGTLRQALLDAEAGDAITFKPSAFPPDRPVTIFIRSTLPTLGKNSLTIDASGTGVILDGTQAPAGTNGLIIEGRHCRIQGLRIQYFASNGVYIAAGATNNTVGGDRSIGAGPNGQGNLIASNGGSGLEIRGNGNLVQGNYIGVDPTGWWDWGNAFNGVAIWKGASNNIIGGTSRAECQAGGRVVPGRCNVIGGNRQNGVWLGGSGTRMNQVTGNYVGTRADGLGTLGNHYSGVSIQDGGRDNLIGDNLISGNSDNGLYIGGLGTSLNRVLGNTIGADWQGQSMIGQGGHGVVITLGASQNAIGNGTPAGRNVIGGNHFDGIRIEGGTTISNTVQGNTIGANADGAAPLPNALHAVELADDTNGNLIGGNRLAGEGNLLSGDLNHGTVITSGAHHNRVSGNIIGPDASGTRFLGNHPFGGIDISNGAHHNIIGGLAVGEGNVISGNPTDGIAFFSSDGRPVADNQLLGNLIGVALDGTSALPNHGWGVLITEGVVRTRIEGNTIAFNKSEGILVAKCEGTTITANSIYSNTLQGIRNESDCPPAPTITGVAVDPTEVITGTTTVPNGRVEIFADSGDQGGVYEGFTLADGAGNFSFTKAAGFSGPNVTATVMDASGNTSPFSRSSHLAWTILLYLNGDNDLQEAIFETLDSLAAAGPSPRANVLALVDGFQGLVPARRCTT